MTNRMSVFGRGQGIDGDQTTTGATCLSSLPQAHCMGRGILRQGDFTTPCPLYGKTGEILDGESRMKFHNTTRRASRLGKSLSPGIRTVQTPALAKRHS